MITDAKWKNWEQEVGPLPVPHCVASQVMVHKIAGAYAEILSKARPWENYKRDCCYEVIRRCYHAIGCSDFLRPHQKYLDYCDCGSCPRP